MELSNLAFQFFQSIPQQNPWKPHFNTFSRWIHWKCAKIARKSSKIQSIRIDSFKKNRQFQVWQVEKWFTKSPRSRHSIGGHCCQLSKLRCRCDRYREKQNHWHWESLQSRWFDGVDLRTYENSTYVINQTNCFRFNEWTERKKDFICNSNS